MVSKMLTIGVNELSDDNHGALFTAYIIFNKRHLLTKSMDDIKKLEVWLLTQLNDYTTSLGLIIDNTQGKMVAKHTKRTTE